MKYLEYTLNGFKKKFPFNTNSVTMGRSASNGLIVDNQFISRIHAKLTIKNSSLIVNDLNSTEGITVNKKKRKKFILKEGEQFSIGDIDFVFKNDNSDDFTVSEGFLTTKTKFTRKIKKDENLSETNSSNNLIYELGTEILKKGLRMNSFSDFLDFLSKKLNDIPDFGSLYLIRKGKNNIIFVFSVNGNILHNRLIGNKIFTSLNPHNTLSVPDKKNPFYFFPIVLNKEKSGLIYFLNKNIKSESDNMKKFLKNLSENIELIFHFYSVESRSPKITNKSVGKHGIIYSSSAMKNIIEQAKKIALSDIFVLIEGESGTGKELLVKLIHENSKRSHGRFIALNCAAIPETLLESELFGHEKGAFTGAITLKKGKLEIASGGTLVLDEIGDMPLNLQSKLLRAIQEQEFYRLGGTEAIKVDLRIISLTHRNLLQCIEEKTFRQDLYYRLVHRSLKIPPLRERKEDINTLINYFTNRFTDEIQKNIKGYSIKALEALINHKWPGNVRQLKNEINSIINLIDDGNLIDFDILSNEIKNEYKKIDTSPGKKTVNSVKIKSKDDLVEILKRNNWNKSKTASEIGITYHGLHKKLKRLGIKKPKEFS